MINLLLWILFGIIAGSVAGYITKDKRGWIGDMIVGMIGSFLAGWASTGFTSFQQTNFSLRGMFLSILGAVVFILLLNLIMKRK